jgi:ATP-dependent DNA helicase DinG
VADRENLRSVLTKVVTALPAAEERLGQQQMAEAVADSIKSGRHLVVQAGTGTGKTLAYLVPALLAGKRVVVATATKALQDQLAAKDLPFLETHLGRPFDWAVLKGRSNYICMQRVRELQSSAAGGQLEMEELAPTTKVEINRLCEWSGTTKTGDQADLTWSPADRSWQAVSVSSDECPGGTRCPMGSVCFAELARARAGLADVVVVNLHLYGLNVAGGNVLLPEHEVVVIDEAHQLEDIMSDTVGVQIGPGRFTNLAAVVRRVIDDPTIIAELADSAPALREALRPYAGDRLSNPFPDDLQDALVKARGGIEKAQSALRKIETDVPEAQQRKIRAQQVATRVQEHIDVALGQHEGYVAFVSGSGDNPRLEIAPLDVGPVLSSGIWTQRTAILTSATLPSTLAHRVGIADSTFTQIDVGSPFDYASNAVLYCAMHLPDPRSPDFAAATHDELAALIGAAGGRTLALFTSWKAMDAAAAAVKQRVEVPILTQRDLPKTALVKAFTDDESSCLFATAGFFQGVDIPGRTLSLVTIDRIPFPRPDDPLLTARRELLGPAAFGEIDLPRAAMMLAQATGRLIRSATDRGVVAVFDRRLGTANYRWQIIGGLPPMRRTKVRGEVEAFLREITT